MNSTRSECVVVTGAASGIGREVARTLLAEGTRVAALDVAGGMLGEAFVDLEDRGPWIRVLDVTDETEVTSAINEIESRLGPITGLVNAAGSLVQGELRSQALTLGELRRAFAVNVEGVWLVSRAVACHMSERKSGSIVTLSSNAGKAPRVGMGAYCASKAAATMLTRCLGLELAPHGIRCNVVSPGSTETPMLRALVPDAANSKLIDGDLATFRLGIPLGRIATPSDIAQVVTFLISERSRHVTLQDVCVDGGATL